jgi:hypothetical protein
MTDPAPVPTPVRVTYAELAKARGVSLAAARKLALRHRWPKQVGNDGLAHVLVPASFMEDAGGETGIETGVPPDLRTTVAEILATQRAERDAERERADRAERAIVVLRAKLVAVRYAREVEVADLRRRLDAETEERRRLTAVLEDRRGQGWWPWKR